MLCSVIMAEGFGNKEDKVTCVVSGDVIEGDYKEESTFVVADAQWILKKMHQNFLLRRTYS